MQVALGKKRRRATEMGDKVEGGFNSQAPRNDRGAGERKDGRPGKGCSPVPDGPYLGVGVQRDTSAGPVTRRRITQDRVKRFSRSGSRASGQGPWPTAAAARDPQLGLSHKVPFGTAILLPHHSSTACCCFLSQVSSSFRDQPFPAPRVAASASVVFSRLRPDPSETAASRPTSRSTN